MRKIMFLSLGLAVFLIGCDASNPESNNTVPQNGKVDKNAKSAGGPPVTGEYNIPAGYPTKDAMKKSEAAAKKDGEATDKAAPKEEDKAAKKEGDKAAKNDVKLSDKEIAGINKLGDAKDRELALAQKVCPISDEHLGGMGAPLKVSADGKTAFLCCEDCKKDFDKDPKAALAKIGK